MEFGMLGDKLREFGIRRELRTLPVEPFSEVTIAITFYGRRGQGFIRIPQISL
jgi:hypothetical protein